MFEPQITRGQEMMPFSQTGPGSSESSGAMPLSTPSTVEKVDVPEEKNQTTSGAKVEIQTKQINIVQVYEEDILKLAQMKIVDIRNNVIDLWNKEPIVTQFPDLVAIIEPTQQLSCVVQGRRVTISNQNVAQDFTSRDLDNFIRFVININNILSRLLKAFGFNYSFQLNFPADDLPSFQTKNNSLINTSRLNIGNSLVGSGVNIAYTEESNRIQFITTPIYSEDLQNIVGLSIQANVHFFKSTIPSFSELLNLYKKYHGTLEKKINNIYSSA